MAQPGSLGFVHDDELKSWDVIGAGGFGQICKVKHVKWGMNVAIKLLLSNDGSGKDLLSEAEMMQQGGHPNVVRIMGIYEGQPPCGRPSSQLGLVMEFMEKGSLASLLNKLEGPPPWPLVFRLAHQIALGMNYLHNLSPPVLHLDLKPSNVLLDDSLSAKLTDFGLAKVVRSVSKSTIGKAGEVAGTINYMPPEAFNLGSYKPTFASDVYSYGIVLWSIGTGKEPYGNALPSMVILRIPKGDRPSLDDESLDCSKVVGLQELKDLMEECWHEDPKTRPSFHDCLKVTEDLYDRHKPEEHRAIHQVHENLGPETVQWVNGLIKPPVKINVQLNGVQFVDKHRAKLIKNVRAVDIIADDLLPMIGPEKYANIKAAQTSHQKMRVIFDYLNSEVVKEKFYQSLLENERYLVEELAMEDN
ncbi:receptor-interacting serine/threonine-protein kinase 3-like [Chanos chanos]|uniref:Receptor-interacting serine/threonine-protein kinase 3-like n=1 Tax=Chanos chanos TaxID=29144 RepID=A0A6J2VU83_CHACN|nr:receptor-interacting serine/threonine-protein kinase 3-like [Chanos chanos]